jgi:thiosulfate dehydrogenase
MSPSKTRITLIAAVTTTAALGGALVMGQSEPAGPDAIPREATVEYGRRLIRQTAALIGPNAEDPSMRYSGSNLDCASCHLQIGMDPGQLSLLGATPRYPRHSGRDGQMQDMRSRINGCMERSMNGQMLPRDSVELIAMELFLANLNEQYEAMGKTNQTPVEPPLFEWPNRRSDPEAGRLIYEQRCVVCHGENGEGLLETGDPKDGYLFPPLWGPDSYNDGAGMHRVLTAARFIKARMPLGQPDLTDDEAYDVAAFMNSQPRPQKDNLEADYPDRLRKPFDSPYPPYVDGDPFPQDQHKYGPFQPIRDWYTERREAARAGSAGEEIG